MSDERLARPLPRAMLAVVVALALTAAGCGGDDGGGGDGAQTAPAPETQPTDTQETTEEGEEATAAIDPADGDPQAGEGIFADNCSTCHGSTGAGAAAGPSLQDPDLADDPQQVVDQIVNGGGGMPPFGDQLSDQEIADVAAFVIEDLTQR